MKALRVQNAIINFLNQKKYYRVDPVCLRVRHEESTTRKSHRDFPHRAIAGIKDIRHATTVRSWFDVHEVDLNVMKAFILGSVFLRGTIAERMHRYYRQFLVAVKIEDGQGNVVVIRQRIGDHVDGRFGRQVERGQHGC